VAGMCAYRARDAVATAMHGMWGSFWIAYGILNSRGPVDVEYRLGIARRRIDLRLARCRHRRELEWAEPGVKMGQ